MPFPPTPQQSAILDFTRTSSSNLMIRAYAGCGKTSTLELIDSALGPSPKLLLCFNKAIAVEAASRFRPTTQAKTFNSIGHRIFSDAIPHKITLNPKKIPEIFKSITQAASRGEREQLWKSYDLVLSGVNLARAIGYIPSAHPKSPKRLSTQSNFTSLLDSPPTPDELALIDRILLESIRLAYLGTIDYSDQIYMPTLFTGIYPEFPIVLVDEYQDLSPINQAMVARLTRRARQIGVGDEAQAIYGFRGADANSMPNAIDRFNMAVFPLSLTFRCPSRIVENVRWRVPDFEAYTFGGTVNRFTCKSISNISNSPSVAVICRNNAPLISLAMRLTLLGRHVDIAGIDIGARLITQLTRLGPESLTQAQTISAIETWESEHSESKTSRDTAACLLVFAHQATSLGGAILYAKHLLSRPGGTIKFMSGHKSKGLEFDHIYHLDNYLLQPIGQDPNLRYVIDTRTKSRLDYIQTEQLGA